MKEWVNISERGLPKCQTEMVEFLVTNGHKIWIDSVARMQERAGPWIVPLAPITHYMELPAPPS